MLGVVRRILRKNARATEVSQEHRKEAVVRQLDFIIDTLQMNKFDIFFMENLKMPLTHDEQIYFTQQVDRINSAVQSLEWMRENVCSTENFFLKFLRRGG